jgi:peptidoglycan/xylan/chitin deacetylase (PgdA/CDA1 family)
VTLDHLVARLSAGHAPDPNEVVLTVDDAYADFYEVALPVLERMQVPATLYVPTDFVDLHEWLWPDRLLWMVQASEAESVSFESHQALPLGTLPQRRDTWNALADDLLERTGAQRADAFAELEQRLGVEVPAEPTEDFRPMSWEQLRDASRRGVTVGSHSTAHLPLARESPALQETLILKSKRRLEDQLQQTVSHFCYPHGRLLDFDAGSISVVQKAGFVSATAAVTAIADPERLCFSLPRISPAATTSDLRSQLSGISQVGSWASV